MVLVIARCPSSITVRKLKRYRFITNKWWKLCSTLGATQ